MIVLEDGITWGTKSNLALGTQMSLGDPACCALYVGFWHF
jgi:hypothetical protein